MTKKTVFPPGKGQLFYAKSKVYLHPTSKKSDNIEGYLVIVKPFPMSKFEEFVVAFIPRTDLSSDDVSSLDEFDLYGLDGKDFDFYAPSPATVSSSYQTPKIVKFINRPVKTSISSYAFGFSIDELYSIQVRPKTSNLWYGSIIFHPRYETDQIPPVFFHDDECEGTKREEKLRRNSFEPFCSNIIGNNQLYWGGDRFLSLLKSLVNIKQSKLEQGMFLVNSTDEDSFNFIPSTVEAPVDTTENYLNNLINTTKWSILTNLAQVTSFAKNHYQNLLNNDNVPLFVKKFLKFNKDQPLDFDSANVYLAKWALKVQEEAEQSRKMIIGNNYYNDLIKSEFGDNFIELTPLEVSNATRHSPIDKSQWSNFFDQSGRLKFTKNEILKEIFHSSVEQSIRTEVWPFLLGIYPWDSSDEERKIILNSLNQSYIEYKNNWKGNLDKQQNDDFFKDQKFRIFKDVKRNDRNIDLYKDSDDDEQDDNEDEEQPNFEFKNPHLNNLADILLTYNELNHNLGYVQGMTDLLSPLYYIFQDEVLTFWCFVKFMERMERNFIRDLSGMKNQMITLTELVQFMLPDLYIHLEKCDSSNLFFFFRMLLVWFKRELPFDETLQLWEVLWTDYYSSQFILFFALAILQKNSKVIINNLHSFEDILKYTNDLNGNHQLGELLTRAELLFVKFKQMVELIDRKHLKNQKNPVKNSNDTTSPISDNIRLLLSKEIIVAKEEVRTENTPFG